MNDNLSQQSEPQVVRVDLTSQDLRTGTIRLPRQLHGHFSEGELAAEDLLDQHVHLLTVMPPRDLQGLNEFMEKHGLQTNDAVVMHVDGQELQLEPFYRRPQAQQPGDDVDAPASDSFHEQAGDNEQAGGSEQAGASEHASGDDQTETGAEAAESASPEPEQHDPAPQPTAEQAQDENVDEPKGTAAEEQNPFDSFADYDDMDDFADDNGTTFQVALGERATPAAETPAEAPVETPRPAVPEAPPAPIAEPAPIAAPVAPDPYHTTARRPFTLASGPLAMRRPASFAQQFAERKDVPQQQQQQQQSQPAPAEQAAQPDTQVPADNHSLVENYLNTPGLPSILNAADLAGRLNIDKDELIEILGKLAGQPNSRLSTVRPGFYLLKRADNN